MASTTSSVDLNRVLLIEDDEIDRKTLIRALKSASDIAFSCVSVSSVGDAQKNLRSSQFDLVVTDLNLPDSYGLDTVRTLLESCHNVAIVVLSGSDDETLALDAVQAGIEDFIPKRYIGDRNLILRTLRHAMERHRLKRGLRATRDREYHLAHYDQITQLPNRLLFLDRISQSVVQAQRNQEKFTLCFIDLDRFKYINDTLGHGAGDEVLRTVSARLLKCVRSSDTVARLGGDEFTLILHNTNNEKSTSKIALQITEEVNRPIRIGHRKCNVGVSIGIANYPEHGNSPDKLLKNADIAMYEAKRNGRNQHRFFNYDLSEVRRQAFELESALKESLESPSSELCLHFQPKVNLVNGRVSSAEALIRWMHPKIGNIPPDQFIPVAEESGLIEQLDIWTLRQACYHIRQWQDQELDQLRVGINISGRSFNNPDFVETTVVPILKEHRINWQTLEFEITESVFLSDIDQVQRQLAKLKKLGIYVAIDDFGTGFSSLNYLKNLQIDTLKIDGSFICDDGSSSKDKAILKAIIELGKAMEVNLVAECIETNAQYQFLKQLGCHEGQGYISGKPHADWTPPYTRNRLIRNASGLDY